MTPNGTQQDTSPKGNRWMTRLVAAGALAAALALSSCGISEGTTTLQADTLSVVAADTSLDDTSADGTSLDDTATTAQFVAGAVPAAAPEVSEEDPAVDPAVEETPTPPAIPLATNAGATDATTAAGQEEVDTNAGDTSADDTSTGGSAVEPPAPASPAAPPEPAAPDAVRPADDEQNHGNNNEGHNNPGNAVGQDGLDDHVDDHVEDPNNDVLSPGQTDYVAHLGDDPVTSRYELFPGTNTITFTTTPSGRIDASLTCSDSPDLMSYRSQLNGHPTARWLRCSDGLQRDADGLSSYEITIELRGNATAQLDVAWQPDVVERHTHQAQFINGSEQEQVWLQPGITIINVAVNEALLPGTFYADIDQCASARQIDGQIFANGTPFQRIRCGDPGWGTTTTVPTNYHVEIVNSGDQPVGLLMTWEADEPAEPATPPQPKIVNEGDGPNNPRPFNVAATGGLRDDLSSDTDPVDAFRISSQDPFFKIADNPLFFDCRGAEETVTLISVYADGQLVDERNCVSRPVTTLGRGEVVVLDPTGVKNFDIVFKIATEGQVQITISPGRS